MFYVCAYVTYGFGVYFAIVLAASRFLPNQPLWVWENMEKPGRCGLRNHWTYWPPVLDVNKRYRMVRLICFLAKNTRFFQFAWDFERWAACWKMPFHSFFCVFLELYRIACRYFAQISNISNIIEHIFSVATYQTKNDHEKSSFRNYVKTISIILYPLVN